MHTESWEKIIESIGYIEYDCRIQKVDLLPDILKVEFSIVDTEGGSERTNVTMIINDPLDYLIKKDDHTVYTNFMDDHPLLWRFSDIQCELYINGKTKSLKELFFDLSNIHHSLFKHFLPFDRHMLSILENGHGLFQKGPNKLLNIYAGKLKEYGIKTSIIGGYLPNKVQPKILFLSGSYFIGYEYKFELSN